MFQNRLMGHMWNRSVQQMRRDDDMRIKCLVAGSVVIKDLQREFFYGQEEIVSAHDYNKSKDIRNAISKGWLQITDRYHQQNVSQQNQEKQIQDNTVKFAEDNKELITKLAKEMASEMVKEVIAALDKQSGLISPSSQQIAKPLAPPPISRSQPVQAVEIEEDTFVKMNEAIDDNDSITRVDLSKQSETKVVDDNNIKASLAKIKALRKKS